MRTSFCRTPRLKRTLLAHRTKRQAGVEAAADPVTISAGTVGLVRCPLPRIGDVVSFLIAVSLAAAITGCAANPAATHLASRPSSEVSPTKVLTFVVENHSLDQMQADMPYLNGLAQRYAYATDFTAITHPSLPNYLAMVGGSTFGVTDDSDPSVNATKVGGARSVFDQALASRHTAKLYAESMPSNCAPTSTGLYAVRHNPWAYFGAGRTGCATFDVPSGTPSSGALATDIGSGNLPNVGLVIPNLCNDAHKDGCPLPNAGSLTLTDTWLRGWLPQIVESPDFTSGRLVLVVTADEDDYGSGNKILTVVLHATSRPGEVVTAPLTHYSLCRLYSQVIGATPLGNARTSPDMRAAFGL